MKKIKKRSSAGIVFTAAGLLTVLIGIALLIAAFAGQVSSQADTEDNSYVSATGSQLMDASADGSEADREEDDIYTSMKKVLFISSYDPTAAYYQDQINGILSVSDLDELEYDVLNMDTYKHHSDADLSMCEERARQMMSETDYEGIIAADDAALRFVEDRRTELFAGLPVVFFGINDHAEGTAAAENDPLMTGYLEPNNIESVLDMALNLKKNTEKAVFITDLSLTSNAVEESIAEQRESEKYQGLDFEIVNFSSMTVEQLKDQLAAYRDGTVVIFVNAFEDVNGNYHTASEMSHIICNAADVPVFRTSKGGYGNGVCGGMVTDMKSTAAKAAKLMKQILEENLDISDMPAMESNEVEYVASYEVMRKFGLSLKDLPEETLIIGKPETFNEKYGRIFYPMAIIVAGLLLIMIGYMLENRARSATARQLQFAMHHDSLTGLYNRQAALQKMAEDPRMKKDYAVILLDLDDFQDINETYGHDNGDVILRSIALELDAIAREMNGELCRYGGDEFLLVFFNRTLGAEDEVVKRIMRVFRRERRVGFDTIHPYGSAGIANSIPGVEPTEMILKADLALNRSKQKGKDIATVYTPDLYEAETRREKTRNSVLDAIRNDGLYMLYQPQVDCQSGRLIGFESLVRMKNASIGPGVFIPLAEENGWIREIGRRRTELTIKQIAAWRQAGLTPPPVSINYSAGQLSDTEYVSYLSGLLKKYGISPDSIRLEVTERMAMSEDEEVRSFYRQVKEAGISLHMDDFGTGYSSFSALSQIPVGTVKIDKSLVDAYLNEKNRDVFRDIVDMLHALHKFIIVEGVETKEQYLMLKDFAADAIQGYYFGRPLSGQQAEEDIRRQDLLS